MNRTPATARSSERKLIAPLWHTVVLVVFLILFSLFQATQVSRMHATHLASRLPLYLASECFELITFGYVWLLGFRRRGVPLRDIIGGKWSKWTDALRDVGIAILFWFVVIGMLSMSRLAFGEHAAGLKAIKFLLPQGVGEMLAWAVVSVTAGFCEEVVFRGYLQKQFLALTGGVAIAVIIQAIVFGAAHLYQGIRQAATITIYGALFGILAVWRKSLRPGMIQHGAQDLFSGILGSLLSNRF